MFDPHILEVAGNFAGMLFLTGLGIMFCFDFIVGLCLIAILVREKRGSKKSLRRPIRKLRKAIRANESTPELKTLENILRSIEQLRKIAPDKKKVAAQFAIEITIAVDLAKTYNEPYRYRKQSKRYQNLLGDDQSIRYRVLRGLEAVEDAIIDEIGEVNILKANPSEVKVDDFVKEFGH